MDSPVRWGPDAISAETARGDALSGGSSAVAGKTANSICYWYAAFTVRVSSSVSSSVGLSGSPSPDFVGGATGFGSVVDVTPGTVNNRRPTFTRSPALGRRFFLIMRNPPRSQRRVNPASARPNVLIVQYLQYFQIADRGRAVGPMRRTLHHWLCPVGCHIDFAYVSKDVLPTDEALEAWRQLVATRRTEDGAHTVEILDRIAVDRRPLIGVASGPAYLCGPVRPHRGHARHADRAPSKPHAFASLPREPLPTHELILPRGLAWINRLALGCPDPACSHPPHRLLRELGAIRAVDFAEPFETNAILLTTIGTDVAAVHLIACSTERSCQTIQQLPPKFL